MKRIGSILLALVLLCSGAPLVAAEGPQSLTQTVALLQEGRFPSEAVRSGAPRRSRAASSGVAAARETILAGLQAVEDRIDLSAYALTPAEVRTAYQAVVNDHPELFYATGGYTSWNSNGVVVAVEPVYTGTKEAILPQKATYESKLTDILDLIRDEWTAYEKALFVHDYLAENYCYDETLKIFDAYSFFTQKTGVCQAYTLAYTAVLQRLGIPVTRVISEAMNHTWNLVQLEGVWYHVDVTWDDPVGARFGLVHHNNFLAGDEGITKAGHHDWYYTGETYTCPQNHPQYDRLHEATTPAVELNGTWYYIAAAGNQYALFGTDWQTDTAVKSLTDHWPVVGQPKYYWPGWYSGLGAVGDTLVYNTPDAVYRLNPVTGAQTAILTVGTDTSALYGLQFGLDGARYATQASPNDTDSAQIGSLSLEHSHRFARFVEKTAATCGADAVQSSRCAYCGATTDRTVAGQRPAHTWNAGVVTRKPTAVEDGERTYTCTECGASKTEPIPAAPQYAFGNTNGDGHVDIRDLVYIQEAAEGVYENACDLNEDAAVDALDLEIMRRILLGLTADAA